MSLSFPLYAADFIVTTNIDINSGACTASSCSLRDAILAANTIAEPSTIQLPPGNHVITIAGSGEDASVTGDFDVTGDLTIIGAGRDVTGINIMSPSEQIIDVAAGGRLRLEHLSIGIGLRSGGFGGGDAATTRVELFDVQAGGIYGPGDTIVAKGNLLIDHSSIYSGAFSNGQTAISLSDGEQLDITNSTVDWRKVGLRINLAATGSARVAKSFLSRIDYGPNACGSLSITGGQHVRILGSQIDNGRSQSGLGSCISGVQDVAVIDSTFKVDSSSNQAIFISAATTTVRNSTIAGSLAIGQGTTLLDQATVGSNVSVFGDEPVSVARGADAIVTVSNSALIGMCSRSLVALGNNVESPGNSCGLPAASSRVGQTYASLELGTLASHTPPGAARVPDNYLPSAMSVLNRVFTRLGILRCQATDQRGYVRADVCTIGAVETDASEQVLFRNGFDN
ncbi:MAG: CSLREA domain-containing protein [Dokdonella sp.]